MNISPLTVVQLRELGWDIIRVSEVMDNRTKDAEILTYGQIHDRLPGEMLKRRHPRLRNP
jgi:hypothetical protein